jgi:hypothetical protein
MTSVVTVRRSEREPWIGTVRLSHETLRDGVRFTFRRTSLLRVAYFHVRSQRLIVLTADEQTVLSLSRRSVNDVRALPDSTYGR